MGQEVLLPKSNTVGKVADYITNSLADMFVSYPPTERRRVNSRTIAATAIFTAFVAAVTMAFVIYIPATKGYFDIGEIMVYIVAMLMGPYIGAFAGGVGSAISDVILAPQYAPGTLVIKGLEGLIVGYLTNLPLASLTRRKWLVISGVLGLVIALLISFLGTSYLSGDQQLYLGFSSGPNTTIGPQFSAEFVVPPTFWIVLGAITFVLVLAAGYSFDAKLGWTILSILIGGSEMVIGYFLFESIGLQLGFVTASVEVPINLGQVLVGLIVAVPVVRGYRRMVRRSPLSP
jgi:uncharacterized membrane protein